MTKVHKFRESLKVGENSKDDPFWWRAYKTAFPDLVNMMHANGNHTAQRQGVDRVLILQNGRILKVDEKKRTKDYGDILLEYLSNDKTSAPGWIEKPLVIDYLAYAILPSKKVYLFDWLMLRQAWASHGRYWKKKYRTIKAHNEGYTTHSVAVPVRDVYRALYQNSIIQVPNIIMDKAS